MVVLDSYIHPSVNKQHIQHFAWTDMPEDVRLSVWRYVNEHPWFDDDVSYEFRSTYIPVDQDESIRPIQHDSDYIALQLSRLDDLFDEWAQCDVAYSNALAEWEEALDAEYRGDDVDPRLVADRYWFSVLEWESRKLREDLLAHVARRIQAEVSTGKFGGVK
jgi:hypothetical protein